VHTGESSPPAAGLFTIQLDPEKTKTRTKQSSNLYFSLDKFIAGFLVLILKFASSVAFYEHDKNRAIDDKKSLFQYASNKKSHANHPD
jgi:hypothetical protein